MKDIDGDLWAAFEQFVKTYPEDPAARATLELAQWFRALEAEIPPKPQLVASLNEAAGRELSISPTN